MSLPEAKHLPWLLFPSRFLQDTCSASVKITPVNAQQLMIKINSFVSSSWTTFLFKWVVVCKWSIKWLCSSIINLEGFQKPMPSFVFLPSLNCYFQIHLFFFTRWACRTWKDVFFVFLFLKLNKPASEPASIPVHCVSWTEHTSVQGCSIPLKSTRERQKKERKKLMLRLTRLPFSNLNGYHKPLVI